MPQFFIWVSQLLQDAKITIIYRVYGKDEQENKEITDEKNGAPPLLRINAGFEMDVELNMQ